MMLLFLMLFFSPIISSEYKLDKYTIVGMPDYVKTYCEQNSQPQGQIKNFLENNKISAKNEIDFSGITNLCESAIRRNVLYSPTARTPKKHLFVESLKIGSFMALLGGASYVYKDNAPCYPWLSIITGGAVLGSTIKNIFGSAEYHARQVDSINELFDCKAQKKESNYVLYYKKFSELDEKAYSEEAKAIQASGISACNLKPVSDIYAQAFQKYARDKKNLPSLGFRYYWLQWYRSFMWQGLCAGAVYALQDKYSFAPMIGLGIASAMTGKYVSNMFGQEVENKRTLQLVKNLRDSNATNNPQSLKNTWLSWFALCGNDTY